MGPLWGLDSVKNPNYRPIERTFHEFFFRVSLAINDRKIFKRDVKRIQSAGTNDTFLILVITRGAVYRGKTHICSNIGFCWVRIIATTSPEIVQPGHADTTKERALRISMVSRVISIAFSVARQFLFFGRVQNAKNREIYVISYVTTHKTPKTDFCRAQNAQNMISIMSTDFRFVKPGIDMCPPRKELDLERFLKFEIFCGRNWKNWKNGRK